MSSKVRDPLVDVAMNYVSDANITLSTDARNEVRASFRSLIKGGCKYSDVSRVLGKYTTCMEPLERIQAILDCVDCPIPHEFDETNEDTPGKSRKKTRTWSAREDQRLLMSVQLYGIDNWAPVTDFVGNGRTRAQCSQRWTRVLDPRISKGHWTMEEENNLFKLVQVYGEQSWMRVSADLGTRSDVQCRYHYGQMKKSAKERHLLQLKASFMKKRKCFCGVAPCSTPSDKESENDISPKQNVEPCQINNNNEDDFEVVNSNEATLPEMNWIFGDLSAHFEDLNSPYDIPNEDFFDESFFWVL